jgi:hypothetical protein
VGHRRTEPMCSAKLGELVQLAGMRSRIMLSMRSGERSANRLECMIGGEDGYFMTSPLKGHCGSTKIPFRGTFVCLSKIHWALS